MVPNDDILEITVTPIGRRHRWTIAPRSGGDSVARGEQGSHADAWREAMSKKMKLELDVRLKPPEPSIHSGLKRAPGRRTG